MNHGCKPFWASSLTKEQDVQWSILSYLILKLHGVYFHYFYMKPKLNNPVLGAYPAGLSREELKGLKEKRWVKCTEIKR